MELARNDRRLLMRIRFAVAALCAAAGLLSAGSASANEGPEAGGRPVCVGLNCPEAEGGLPATAQSRWMATTVSGPEQLKHQKRSGFYEFGAGTVAGDTAIAYVIPPGQLDRAPASVRATQVVRDIQPSDFQTGTVVVFTTGSAGWFPQGESARIARKIKRRPVARAAADAYGCADSYFCIFNYANWWGGRYQWHDINSGSNWVQLSDWGINDWAGSSRNRRDRDSWLAEHHSGGGDRHCYDSHSSDADFGGWADDASSLYNSAGDAGC